MEQARSIRAITALATPTFMKPTSLIILFALSVNILPVLGISQADDGAFLPGDFNRDVAEPGENGIEMLQGSTETFGVGSNVDSPFSFTADPFTGSFNYSVPIFVPPARQGAEPKIQLTYNSSAQNSWCGVGWDLQVGAIERETRFGVPRKWVGTNPANEYENEKGFVFAMGGVRARLVHISGNEYRAQIEGAFLLFRFFENYWEVTDKSGNKFFFGQSATSRMQHPNWQPGLSKSTFRWALSRIEDVNGNRTILEYQHDEGQQYLSQISYNGNINPPQLPETHWVQFTIGNRPDSMVSFRSGYRVETRKRLSQIRSGVGADQARKYDLAYVVSPSTSRSLLQSITERGTDNSARPTVVFAYQQTAFQWEPPQEWGPFWTPQPTSGLWGTPSATENSATFTALVDLDGDGLPDRAVQEVLRNGQYNFYRFQRSTGIGFGQLTTYHGLEPPGWYDPVYPAWNSIVASGYGWNTTEVVENYVALQDINGDGLPDRIMRDRDTWTPLYFRVQLNNGWGFDPVIPWGPFAIPPGMTLHWSSPTATWLDSTYTALADMNGDGLPDRIRWKSDAPHDRFHVEINHGSGFNPSVDWLGVSSPHSSVHWNSIAARWMPNSDIRETYVMLLDMNGDGLPDRVMRKGAAPYNTFLVQLNNGAGFQPPQEWGPVDNPTGDSWWGSPNGVYQNATFAALVDINGDGLPDRVRWRPVAPYDRFLVQLNTGKGFGQTIEWLGVSSPFSSVHWNSLSAVWPSGNHSELYVDLLDINGDGLPDRVMKKGTSPFDKFIVQLNKGPFPDLLRNVSNGVGGELEIAYLPSTRVDNKDSGGVNRLPFIVHTVASTTLRDGFGNSATTTFQYQGGYFDPSEREFRGFHRVDVTEPLGGKVVTYFHQSGGRNGSLNGEFEDQNSKSKKGIPYRIEVYGSDQALYTVTLNKVEEAQLHPNGWYFPYISQTIRKQYEGLASYRATASQFEYNVNTGNLVKESKRGEVFNVNLLWHTFTGGLDSVFTHIQYSVLNNPAILNKPFSVKVTDDSAGNNVFRESRFVYNQNNGNLTARQVWLSPPGSFVTVETLAYDPYGNVQSSQDAAGITTTFVYDSSKTFVETSTTGTFVAQTRHDPLSGAVRRIIDPKGLVLTNLYDTFFRLKEVRISTVPNGTPNLWREKFDYFENGISAGISQNYVRKRSNDAVDALNGHETYVYTDGLGRVIQTRVEAENGQYRVADLLYDQRGNVNFSTLPRFSAGSGFTVLSGTHLGTFTQFDALGRQSAVTPAVSGTFNASGHLQSISLTGGDAGSPIASEMVAYRDGTDVWAVVRTDPEGKQKKYRHDAYGRLSRIIELAGGATQTTSFAYDKIGNLLRVTNSLDHVTAMQYDSLGRKTAMIDPNMGTWTYAYDNAGRLIQQIDSKNQKLEFEFLDEIGRLTRKKIHNSTGTLVAQISYTYDNGDATHTVYKGQLFQVSDREGTQRFSYDPRGRIVKSTRALLINGQSYVTEYTYDDVDRIKTVRYPGNVARIEYSYDTGGNLSQVRSLAGTGTQETFYTPSGFNAQGQLTGINFGNGLQTTYDYFGNSKRLQRIRTTKPGSGYHQDLSYTYDKVSNVKTISDAIPGALASLANAQYDDLHRLTSYSRGGTTYQFTYNPIGNVIINPEFGPAQYVYSSSKPQAVTNANGKTYAYDANGNMTQRGSQALIYDEENRLIQVTEGSTITTFGYDASGNRLWRSTGGAATIWIGDIYEVRGGKVLCHVFAGGRRIATFEPQGGVFGSAVNHRYYVATSFLDRACVWPFQHGRTPFTVAIITLAGILCASIFSRRSLQQSWSRRREFAVVARGVPVWQQSLSVLVIVALMLATTPLNVHAQIYNPVFYYYHGDHLGSSNILTDRSGNLVQRYENTAFGKQWHQNNGQAFPLSHRYTGQVFDDVTGLYYYNARYYDPELGRFIQPDTIVPYPGDPQTYNRYSYVNNNPLKYVDPSGHFFFAVIIGAVVGAALGAAIAAVTGGDIFMGALGGAIGGGFGAVGAALGGAIGGSTGAAVGAIAGGATGGAVSAIAVGGDVGMGALTGAIAGGLAWGVGMVNTQLLGRALSPLSVSVLARSLSGGIAAELQGSNFGRGAQYGALGAAVSHSVTRIPTIFKILSSRWVDTPIEGSPKLPESLVSDMSAVRNLDTGNTWWKNGMHAWHAGSNAAISARLGLLMAPIQWLGGLYHELPFDWTSFWGEQRFQGTLNHILDSTTDIIANTYGIIIGNLLSPEIAGPFAAQSGNYIPGPGDPDPNFGGGGRYQGRPSQAWGQYP
jgi:RHS repeat-associated protein